MLYIVILLPKELAMFFECCDRSLELPWRSHLGFIEFPGCESLTELMSTIVQRVGDEIDRTHLPRLMVCWNFTYGFFIFIPTHTHSRIEELILPILLS